MIIVHWLAGLKPEEQAALVGVVVSIILALARSKWPGLEAQKAFITSLVMAAVGAALLQASNAAFDFGAWLLAIVMVFAGNAGTYLLGKNAGKPAVSYVVSAAGRILRASQDK